MKYPKRTQERSAENRTIQDRDIRMMHLAAAAPLATTGHFREFVKASMDMTRRRLRVLRDLGLVQVHVVSLYAQNRYTLTKKGREFLSRVTGTEVSPSKKLGNINRANLGHADAVISLYIALFLAMEMFKNIQMTEFHFEQAIRKMLGPARNTLVPDALAVFTAAGKKLAIAFEADCGSENPSWVATHKGKPYSALFLAQRPLLQTVCWKVCCTVPSKRRLHKLVSALWEGDVVEGLWYFAVADEISEHTVLTDTWVTPRLVEGGKTARLINENPFEPVITKGQHEGS